MELPEIRRCLTLTLNIHEYETATVFDQLEDGSVLIRLRPYYSVDPENYRIWLESKMGISTKVPLIFQADIKAPKVDREIDFYVDLILRDRLWLAKVSTFIIGNMIFEGKEYQGLQPIPMVAELKNVCNNELPTSYFNWKQNIRDCKQYHRQCKKNRLTGLKRKRLSKKKDPFLYMTFPETQLLIKGIGYRGKHAYAPASDYVRWLLKNTSATERTSTLLPTMLLNETDTITDPTSTLLLINNNSPRHLGALEPNFSDIIIGQDLPDGAHEIAYDDDNTFDICEFLILNDNLKEVYVKMFPLRPYKSGNNSHVCSGY